MALPEKLYWTKAGSLPSVGWSDLTFGNLTIGGPRFVAVGGYRLAYSLDGQTWVAGTLTTGLNPAPGTWYRVTFLPTSFSVTGGFFVALAFDRWKSPYDTIDPPKLIFSRDGKTWQENPEKLARRTVKVGSSSYNHPGNWCDLVTIRETDGTPSIILLDSMNDYFAGGIPEPDGWGGRVAIGRPTLTSAGGITFSAYGGKYLKLPTLQFPSPTVNDAHYYRLLLGGTLGSNDDMNIYAVSSVGFIAMYSSSGDSWGTIGASISAPTCGFMRRSTPNRGCVISGAGGESKKVVSGSGSSMLWSQSEMPVSGNWKHVVYGDRFVAAAGNVIAESEDGETWPTTNVNTLPEDFVCGGLAYGAGVYVVISANGSDVYWTGTPQVKTFTVTTRADPVTGGTTAGGGTFEMGASCTITAYVAEGYQFVKWMAGLSDVTTNKSYTYTVSGNITFTAVFELIPEPPAPTAQSVAYIYTGRAYTPSTNYQIKFGSDIWLPLGSLTGAKAGLFDPDKCCTLGFWDGTRWVTLTNKGEFKNIYIYKLEWSAETICSTYDPNYKVYKVCKLVEFTNGVEGSHWFFELYNGAKTGAFHWNESISEAQFQAYNKAGTEAARQVIVTKLLAGPEEASPYPNINSTVTSANLMVDSFDGWLQDSTCNPSITTIANLVVKFKYFGGARNQTQASGTTLYLEFGMPEDEDCNYGSFSYPGDISFSMFDGANCSTPSYWSDLGQTSPSSIPLPPQATQTVLFTSSGHLYQDVWELSKEYHIALLLRVEIAYGALNYSYNWLAANINYFTVTGLNSNQEEVSNWGSVSSKVLSTESEYNNPDPAKSYFQMKFYATVRIDNSATAFLVFAYGNSNAILLDIN